MDVHNYTNGCFLNENSTTFTKLQIDLNRDDKTIVTDEKLLEVKLKRILRDGFDNLQVISDFDYTISRFKNGIQRLQCTHEAIEMHPQLDKQAVEKLRALRELHMPLESNRFIDRSKLKKAMQTWWEQSHSILTSASITKQMIKDVQNVGMIALRDRFDEFVNHLRNERVPLTIFSAGLGDIIQQLLRMSNLAHDLIYIVANFFEFDDNDKAIGFKKPTIHSQNKTLATVSEASSVFSQILPKLNRPNIILLGDTTQDIHMIRGYNFRDCSDPVVLRIGWLNQPTEEKIQQYKELYDIVLIEQENFNIPCQILHWICSNMRTRTTSPSSDSEPVRIEE